jgi:large subunit ribosomal protein L10
MTKEEKAQYIDGLTADLSNAGVFYLADTSGLTVETVNALRRKCFQSNIEMRVVKNTLLEQAMNRVEGIDYTDLKGVLAGPTSIFFAEVGNAPARLIKDFRKKNQIPRLKGAFIDEAIFIGDENLEFLTNIKSKEELIGDIIGLLQSPAKNVISGLKGSGGKIAGILKTLSEKEA